MKFDRDKFWKAYREQFGSVNQPTVDGLDFFLDEFETETRLKNIPQFSYVLATAYHESGKVTKIGAKKEMVRFQPVREVKGSASSSVWKKYQSEYWHTGFYGRGYAQITHEENYRKLSRALGLGNLFVDNPDLVLNPIHAYDVLVVGMVNGLFRKGHDLDRYLSGAKKDYFGAREIINGDKNITHKSNVQTNGNLIANYARKFESILKSSLTAESAKDVSAKIPSESSENQTNLPDNQPSEVFAGESADRINGAENNTTETNESAPAVETKQTTKETTREGNTQIETTVSETSFEAKNIPAFIPRFGKQWLFGLIPAGGLLSTVGAWFAKIPDWLVFVLGMITGVALWKFMELAIKHREKVMDFIRECYRITADPTQNNLIPTNASAFVGHRKDAIETALMPVENKD